MPDLVVAEPPAAHSTVHLGANRRDFIDGALAVNDTAVRICHLPVERVPTNGKAVLIKALHSTEAPNHTPRDLTELRDVVPAAVAHHSAVRFFNALQTLTLVHTARVWVLHFAEVPLWTLLLAVGLIHTQWRVAEAIEKTTEVIILFCEWISITYDVTILLLRTKTVTVIYTAFCIQNHFKVPSLAFL